MGRRLKLASRMAFHIGALLSLILGTCAGGMWIRSHFSSDQWTWLAQEKTDGMYVRQTWKVGTGRGSLWLASSREVSAPPEKVSAELPQSSRFLPSDSEPRFPRLLPTPPTQSLYTWWTPPSPEPLLPRTTYASGYRIPALLSTRKQYSYAGGFGTLARGEWSTPYFAGREWGLIVPLWPIVGMLAVWPACWEFLYRRRLYRKARERWRRQRGLCTACAYDLRATPTRCPECGTEQPQATASNAPSPRENPAKIG